MKDYDGVDFIWRLEIFCLEMYLFGSQNVHIIDIYIFGRDYVENS